MKVLVVEDETYWRDLIDVAFGTHATIEVVFAASRDAAIASLNSNRFDLVVLDLRIPTRDGELDAHTDHGLAVHGHVLEVSNGTPVIILSAYGDENVMPSLVAGARRGDPFGTRSADMMLEFFKKGDFSPAFVDRVETIAQSITALDGIEVATGAAPVTLDPLEERVLRVFSRRYGGAIIRVTPLTGGLGAQRSFAFK